MRLHVLLNDLDQITFLLSVQATDEGSCRSINADSLDSDVAALNRVEKIDERQIVVGSIFEKICLDSSLEITPSTNRSSRLDEVLDFVVGKGFDVRNVMRDRSPSFVGGFPWTLRATTGNFYLREL